MHGLQTKVSLDWGSAAHFAFGLAAALLGCEWLFTAIFLFKQLVDFLGGEQAAEASGDVAEYAAGLFVGKVYLAVARTLL